MNIAEIKLDIETVLGNAVNDVNITSAGNGVYDCNTGEGKYVFAMLGASGNTRTFAQMQQHLKPRIISAYESSKKDQSKFFIMVPDSSNFSCDDFYIFVEIFEKGSNTSSYEIKIPVGAPLDRVTRSKGARDYFVTYVPAKDPSGAKTVEILKQYLFCFDSRPYSRYITKITDFLPSVVSSESVIKMVIKDMWPNNFLVAGAPGTGKSHLIDERIKLAIKKKLFRDKNGEAVEYDELEAQNIIKDLAVIAGVNEKECLEQILKEHVRRVTFYEDFSYESFVGCYKPIPVEKAEKHHFIVEKNAIVLDEIKLCGETSGKQVSYEYEPGVFIKTYIDAVNNREELYFLVIEEINRARAASVFGDMFQLLDRKNGISEYYITPESSLDNYLKKEIPEYNGTMRLPTNMFIWATMNNADQGVFPLDAAFKRRWGYLYIDVNNSNREGDISIKKDKKVRWNIFRSYLNKAILDIATEDKCLGAWYFKDAEYLQIDKYFDCDDALEKVTLLNPLADKLLIYLLNDVCRMNPRALFQEGYLDMPSIRNALFNNIGLDEILNIDWEEIFADNEKWISEKEKLEEESKEESTLPENEHDKPEDSE